MKTLGEISDQISEIGGEYRESTGKNIMVVGSNSAETSFTARVFATLTGGWVSQTKVFTDAPTFIRESEGNIMIVANDKVAVYRQNGGWAPSGSSIFGANGTVRRVAASKGVFAFATDTRAYVIDTSTSSFDDVATGSLNSALVGSD